MVKPVPPPLGAADLYHTGIVVPDLEASMAQFGAVAGYRWTAIQAADLTIRFANGERVLPLRYAYSLDAPHLELVQEIPGTPWTAAASHLGYFCDDVTATSKLLADLGFAVESCAVVDGTPALFAYHLDPSGVRIEIVDRALIPDFAEYLRARTPR
jgi:hypothetical protein